MEKAVIVVSGFAIVAFTYLAWIITVPLRNSKECKLDKEASRMLLKIGFALIVTGTIMSVTSLIQAIKELNG